MSKTAQDGVRKMLGQMLIEAGLIDEIQLTVALGAQKESGLKIGKQLLKLGFVEEGDLAMFLKDDSDVGIPLPQRRISPEALKSVPEAIAFQYKVVPLALVGKSLVLALADPSDLKTIDELSFKLGKNIHPVRAFEWDIESALLKFYKGFSDDELSMLTNVSSVGEQYANAQWSFGNQVLLDEPTIVKAPPKPAAAPAPQRPDPPTARTQEPAARPAPSRAPQTPPQPQPAVRPVPPPAAPVPDEDLSTGGAWESLLDQIEHTSHSWDRQPFQKSRAARILSKAALNLKSNEVLEALIDLLMDKRIVSEEELINRLKSLKNR